MGYLKFDKQEKGYKSFALSKESINANIGKRIVYLRSADIDPHRGYAYPRYALIKGYYNRQLILDNMDYVRLKDIKECGIEDSN